MRILFVMCVAKAVIVSQPLGNVFVYPGESFVDGLYNYFQGEYLRFTSDLMDSELISGGIEFNLSSFVKFDSRPATAYSKILDLTYSQTSFLYFHNDTTVFGYALNLTNGEFSMEFEKTITSLYENSWISQCILINGCAIALMKSYEAVGNELYIRNDLYAMNTTGNNEFVWLETWDIRYLAEVVMSKTDSSKVAFAGGFEYYGIIFIYSFQNIFFPVLTQAINAYYTLPKDIVSYITVIDLEMVFNDLYVLDKYFGLIVYSTTYQFFEETAFINLSTYGTLNSFSYSNSQFLFSTDTIGINTEKCLVVVDLLKNYEAFIVPGYNFENYSDVLASQMTSTHSYLTTYNTSLLLQIGAYVNKTLHSAVFYANISEITPQVDPHGPWLIISGTDSEYYIRQDLDGIRVFSLKSSPSQINITAYENKQYQITAFDYNSSISSALYITMITDLNQIKLLTGFRESNEEELNQAVYFTSNSSEVYLDFSQIISGWNLSFYIPKCKDHDIFYDIDMPAFIQDFQIQDIGKGVETAGFFHSILVFMNSTGVYMNGKLIESVQNPLFIVPCAYCEYGFILVNASTLFFWNMNEDEFDQVGLSQECILCVAMVDYLACGTIGDSVLIYNNEQLAFEITSRQLGGKILDISLSSGEEEFPILYILAAQLFIFQIQENSLEFISSHYVNGTQILSSQSQIYIINQNITVHNADLSIYYKTIPLPGLVTAKSINNDILTLEIQENIYVFNGLVPVSAALETGIYIGTCNLMPSDPCFYLVLCASEVIIYNMTCPPVYSAQAKLVFNLVNSTELTQGEYLKTLTVFVSNNYFNLSIDVNLTLYTYAAVVLFFPDYWVNATVSIDYNSIVSYSLNNVLKGYDLTTVLYINNTIAPNITSPAYLLPSTILTNNYSSLDKLLDHSFIPNTNLILGLTNTEFLVFGISFSSIQDNIPILQRINLSEIVINGSCTDINYISSSFDLSLFASSCISNSIEQVYFQGYLQEIIIVSNYQLVLWEFNSSNFEISQFVQIELEYQPSWIKVIPSSSSCFMIISIDQVTTLDSNVFNNHIIRFIGSWGETISIEMAEIINFVSLGISEMYASCVDGVYESQDLCIDNGLYLYIADLQFGLRVTYTDQGVTKLLTNLPFQQSKIVAVGVCGYSLFTLTLESTLSVYLISQNYIPTFYFTYPISPNLEYFGLNSIISCSDYYSPRYVALYMSQVFTGFYQLRLIDLELDLANALLSEIEIPGNLGETYIGKSIFVNYNTVTLIGVESGLLQTYSINEPQIVMPNMTENDYLEMVEYWNYDCFSVKVLASNGIFSLNTSEFILKRPGPIKNSFANASEDFWWIWLLGSILFLIVLCVAIITYKRVFKKRKISIENTHEITYEIQINRSANNSLLV